MYSVFWKNWNKSFEKSGDAWFTIESKLNPIIILYKTEIQNLKLDEIAVMMSIKDKQ